MLLSSSSGSIRIDSIILEVNMNVSRCYVAHCYSLQCRIAGSTVV